ncbi:hypothetical protein B0H21DRAFT_724329 [Amylocystis lapponica]|nr:hypothetical protein B0H21DRAFT_724329 [Amylocystis lapponica]
MPRTECTRRAAAAYRALRAACALGYKSGRADSPEPHRIVDHPPRPLLFTMKLTTPLTTLTLLLAGAFSQLAAAAPVLETRDVYTPPVLYPHTGTVWTTGQRHNVTWSTADAPVHITNKIGQIQLRDYDTSTPLILASGFNILDGRVEVEVPWVVPGDNYSLVLFGDSGNFSPQFSIQGGPSLF